MNVYREPPKPLPSLRDVAAEEEALGPWARGPYSFEAYQDRMRDEPFIYAELRNERRARERAVHQMITPREHVHCAAGASQEHVFWCPGCEDEATIESIVTGAAPFRLPIPLSGTPVLE